MLFDGTFQKAMTVRYYSGLAVNERAEWRGVTGQAKPASYDKICVCVSGIDISCSRQETQAVVLAAQLSAVVVDARAVTRRQSNQPAQKEANMDRRPPA